MSAQKKAINDYLQALLQDVDEEACAEPLTDTQSIQQKKMLGLETLIAEIPDTLVEEVVEVKVKAEVIVETVIETVIEPVIEPVIEKIDVAPIEEAVPDWAQKDFQCLMFSVSGLTLAVPLVKLNSVMPWTDKLVETPNQTDWYLGLVNNHGRNVKIIDTALMVLPENRHADLSVDPKHRFSHILLVNGSTWGLACDSIGDVIWLSADQVKWRSNKTKRPWLAGTAREHLCALMDTEVFADMINEKTKA